MPEVKINKKIILETRLQAVIIINIQYSTTGQINVSLGSYVLAFLLILS